MADNASAKSGFGQGFASRSHSGRPGGAGRGGVSRLRRYTWSAGILRGLFGELAPAFFFLLVLLRQVSLTLFELIVWFGQDVTYVHGRTDRSWMEIEQARSPPLAARCHRRTVVAARRRIGRIGNGMQFSSGCRRGRNRRHPCHRHPGRRPLCRHRHHHHDFPADGLHSRSGCDRQRSCR